MPCYFLDISDSSRRGRAFRHSLTTQPFIPGTWWSEEANVENAGAGDSGAGVPVPDLLRDSWRSWASHRILDALVSSWGLMRLRERQCAKCRSGCSWAELCGNSCRCPCNHRTFSKRFIEPLLLCLALGTPETWSLRRSSQAGRERTVSRQLC